MSKNEKLEAAVSAMVSGYKVPKGEEKLIHVGIIRGGFDPVTGEKLHKDYTQKYSVAEWGNRPFGTQGDITYVLLHSPLQAEKPKAGSKVEKPKLGAKDANTGAGDGPGDQVPPKDEGEL